MEAEILVLKEALDNRKEPETVFLREQKPWHEGISALQEFPLAVCVDQTSPVNPEWPDFLSDHRTESIVATPFVGILITMPFFGGIAEYGHDEQYRNRQTHYIAV